MPLASRVRPTTRTSLPLADNSGARNWVIWLSTWVAKSVIGLSFLVADWRLILVIRGYIAGKLGVWD